MKVTEEDNAVLLIEHMDKGITKNLIYFVGDAINQVFVCSWQALLLSVTPSDNPDSRVIIYPSGPLIWL